MLFYPVFDKLQRHRRDKHAILQRLEFQGRKPRPVYVVTEPSF
jgi:hypothetical protein